MTTNRKITVYQYALQGARNSSDYGEMSFLGELSQRNLKILAA